MRLSIHHVTSYRFGGPVRFGLQQVRKTPKTTPHQTVLSWHTEITGGRKELVFEDHHNNTTELVSLDRDTQRLDVTSGGEIEVSDTHGIVGAHRGPAPLWLYQRITPRTEARDGVRALLKGLPAESDLDRLHRLCASIAKAVPYETGVSEPTWSAEETLKAGRGVCQDHAHVFIACARHLGLPARYVSGYLLMDGQTDQTAMHAWAEAWLEDLGWVGFDVSNVISPDARYVRVATGLDYSDASPVTGTRIGGLDETLGVQITVAEQ
ncbi:transglutaminase family protein [Roseovarius sp. D22-M7]|uniref:transglutaminase family protein n=1 Tax=Roseovarius sp. D22-M7 TaxID=3127116 RepID=UPI00300FBB13